jgi:arabinofuranosyltransferase
MVVGASVRATPKSGAWIWVPVAAMVLLCEQYSRQYGRNVVDDAMTSMQYAKQLALGNGLVFNVGERVEGYTNFAWVVLMTPIYWLSTQLGFDFVHAVLRCGMALAAANLILVFALARRWLGAGHPAVWLAVGLCLVDNSFSVWAVLGLEVHLLAFFMLLALWAAGAGSRFGWLLLGLSLLGAHLTRPDAGLFCAVVLASQLSEAVLDHRRGLRARSKAVALSTAGAAALWLVGYAFYFFLRYRYYGQLLPNTFYLKLGGPIDAWERGLHYLRGFLHERAWVPLLALFAGLSLNMPGVRALLAYNLLHALYVVYVGGDFFAGHRFFVPEIPQLALLCAVGAAALWDLANRPGVARELRRLEVTSDRLLGAMLLGGACLLAAVFQRGLVLGPLVAEVRTWGDDLTRQTRLFKWLGQQAPADATIATSLIGHTGFYSSLRVIDMYGVIDPTVAKRHVPNFGKGKAGHEKMADPEAVLAKRPTFVPLHMIPGDLWQRGYFLRGDVPRDSFEGIWQRDELLERSTVLSATRVSFDGGRPTGWIASGTAFDSWPSRSRWNGQGQLVGASGGFINTFHPALGNAATGELESAPFELLGDELLFRLAGGDDPTSLRVELLVDSVVVHQTTGRSGDHLSRRAWDITALHGRLAVLRVVDHATGAWGYLALDEITQIRHGNQ